MVGKTTPAKMTPSTETKLPIQAANSQIMYKQTNPNISKFRKIFQSARFSSQPFLELFFCSGWQILSYMDKHTPFRICTWFMKHAKSTSLINTSAVEIATQISTSHASLRKL